MRWYRTAAATLLIGAVAAAAAFTVGPFATVATQGSSMQPAISAGDLVAVGPLASYDVGDVVAYRSTMLDTLVLHRIRAIEGDRYVFQGDDNSWVDPEKPTRDELVGEQMLRIPGGAIWLRRATAAPALAAYTFLLLVSGGAAAGSRRNRRKDRRAVNDSSASSPLVSSLSPSLRPLAAATALLGLAGVVVSGIAWTRPTAEPRPGTPAPATMDFSYTATVPSSPAYDGTTVTAPSPVFRALADTVAVTYRYSGQPGSVTVTAELSTASGWTTSIPLAGAVHAGEGTGTVRLELPALEQRAAAASAVIDLPADALTVAVVPRVALEHGGEFAPRFTLALDKHILKPTSPLTVNETTNGSGTRDEPATLATLGRSIDIATARVAGLVAVVICLLAALALAAAARAGGRVAESERIRRRYGSLLLPVLPVALTPGRPVIDVPDVAALARLAERYGLLVLHWSRSGVDTYVVQDEATTFRYRSDAPLTTVQELPLPGERALPEGDPVADACAVRSWGDTVGKGARRRRAAS